MNKWKKATACLLSAVLLLQGVPQGTAAAEGTNEGIQDTSAAAEFSITYRNGSFVKTGEGVLDEAIGTIEYVNETDSVTPDSVPIKKVIITGTGDYFARQANPQEAVIASEILAEEERIKNVTFFCPETGEGTLKIEMLTDKAKPYVKVNNQEVSESENAVAAVRSNTQFTVNIEATDEGSGVKKVEYSHQDGEYGSIRQLISAEKGEGNAWNFTMDGVEEPKSLYVWISDYCGNRTKAEVLIEIDDKAPVINRETIKATGVEEITVDEKHYWGEAKEPVLELEVEEKNGPVTAVYCLEKRRENWDYDEIAKSEQELLPPETDDSGIMQLLLDKDLLNRLENGTYRITALFKDSLQNITDSENPVLLYTFTVHRTELEIALTGEAAEAELDGTCTAFTGTNKITKDFTLEGGNSANVNIMHPGSIEVSFPNLNGLSISGIHLDGEDISASCQDGILTLNNLENRTGRLELTVAYAMKFTVQYQDGAFLPFSSPLINAKIGTVKEEAGKLEVFGEGAYFARQQKNEGEKKIESEIVSADNSNKVDSVIFPCPERGEGTLTVEMVTDEGMPEVKLTGERVKGSKVYVDKDNNFTIEVNAADGESGVKKVEYTIFDADYSEASMGIVDKVGEKWVYSQKALEPQPIYFWVSDYYNHRTRVDARVVIDLDPPKIHKDTITVTGITPITGHDGKNYWKEGGQYGFRFRAEEENGPIIAVYTVVDTTTGEPVKFGDKITFTQELRESGEDQMYDLPLDSDFINSLPDGTYRIEAVFSDEAENETEKGEHKDFYTFTLNRQIPTVTQKDSTDRFWLKVQDEPDAVKDIPAILKTSQPIGQMSYAVTASTRNGAAKQPSQDAWMEVPKESIRVDATGAAADITYKLPTGAKKDGTVTYYLWVKDALDHIEKRSIICHFDGTVPEFSNFKAELKKSGNPIIRAFQYVFGSILSGKETLQLTVDASDPYLASAYTEFPGLETVELYYMEKDCAIEDDKEQGDIGNEANYQDLVKAKASVQRIKAKDAANIQADGTGTYQFRLQVKKNNKFYKLYFVATDKAGNRKILNAASLADDNTSAFVMVDDKKPVLTSGLKASCAKEDYQDGSGKQVRRWYRGDRKIRYDLSVTDKESGVFSVGASINGASVKKDASGKALYDSSTVKDPERLNVEPQFSYVINPKQGGMEADGGYQLKFRAEDNAGNVSETSHQIYVDKDAPVILEMKFDTGEIDELGTVPTQYGYFFRKQTKVTVSATDYIGNSKITGSGVSVICYKLLPADNSDPITGELSVKGEKDGICRASFNIPEGFKGQMEVSAVDHVGQRSKYHNPKGAVVESPKEHSTTSKAEILLPETTYKDNEGNPLYGSAITAGFDTADSRSGLKQNIWVIREHNASENLAGGTLTIDSVYNEEQDIFSSTVSGDTDWRLPGELDLNLVGWAKREQHIDSDTNHISAVLSITDNAGNTSAARPRVFSIDQTAPVIEVSYDNNEMLNEDFYKETRTATITVTDANFSEEDCDFIITGPQTQTSPWRHHAGTGCDGAVHTNSCSYSCQVAFTQDGDYTFSFSCKDLAGHTASYGKTDQFTIDTAKPVIRVSYDNNASADGSHYQAARRATIEIEDKNFNPADAQLEITAQKDGAVISAPAVSPFTQNGDIWNASISYGEDGDYTFTVAATDKAGNPAEEYAQDAFTVDQTPPELSIEGVADYSANKGTVAPVIKTSDINLDGASLTVTLTGANRGQVSYESSRQQTDQIMEIAMQDFPHTQETDDLYTLEAVVSDRAGNESRQTLVFSVNRFGSVYALEDSTKNLVERFYANQEQDIIITEVNVDTLQYGEISYSLDGNIVTLEQGKDYEVTAQTDAYSWKSYEYRIKAENFRQEGSYVVSLYSEDQAENRSSNKAKGKEVSFVIDKTEPTIVVAGIEDNGQYVDASRNITVDTQDNILLDTVGVYTNDEKKADAGREELLENNGQVRLALSGSNQQQKLYVEAKDAAGNVARSRDIRFLITKNILVQWYSNLPLFVGSIGATATVGAAGFTVFRKRRLRIKR